MKISFPEKLNFYHPHNESEISELSPRHKRPLITNRSFSKTIEEYPQSQSNSEQKSTTRDDSALNNSSPTI